MAYQRAEYADKTLSMNSLADRKLRIKLGSIDFHKETIEKEMKRERKKLQRELGGIDDHLRSRLTVTEIADSTRSPLSPRLPRRFSTPPELLSATLPPALTDPLRKSPLATRRRVASDQGLVSDPLPSDSPSPTALFLKAPFDQPRRQSLPPIGDGGLLTAENSSRRGRRGSYGGGLRSPALPTPGNTSGASSPRSLSRKGSSLNENEMTEVAAKVTRFLQKIDHKEQTEQKKINEEKTNECEQNENEEEFDRCHQEVLMPVKNPSQGLFQPLHFE